MIDEELTEIIKSEIEKEVGKKELAVVETKETADSVIEKQRQKNLNEISENADFKKISRTLDEESVKTELERQTLEILDQKQKNDLANFKLKLLKKALREQVKTEVYAVKLKNAQNRYGYLYETETVEIVDEEGETKYETRYKSFTISKFINRYKEFVNWYKNLTAETQKFIWTTVKFLVRTGIVLAIGVAIYYVVKWLLDSGMLNIAIGG